MRMSWQETHEVLFVFRGLLQVIPVDLSVHELGLSLAERHSLSIYDSMIVAAALGSGCETLYSEDMHHGMLVDGRLTIVNPFL
jgi:predicted nucleic acid-binding protein